VATLAMLVPTLAQEYAAQPVKVTWVWTTEMPPASKLAGTLHDHHQREQRTQHMQSSSVAVAGDFEVHQRETIGGGMKNARTQIKVDDQVG
jgi:hypothetical protein